MDVKLRCMLVKYFHGDLFISVDTSVHSPKATVPCKENASYNYMCHLTLLMNYERDILVLCLFTKTKSFINWLLLK